MRRQPATIICDAARLRATQPAASQAGDWHDVTATTATTAVRPSMAASASSKTAARASSISAVSDHGDRVPPALTPSGSVQYPANKKARRDGSRRAPFVVLAGPGLRAPRCQTYKLKA
jgi:hypothetical protein